MTRMEPPILSDGPERRCWKMPHWRPGLDLAGVEHSERGGGGRAARRGLRGAASVCALVWGLHPLYSPGGRPACRLSLTKSNL